MSSKGKERFRIGNDGSMSFNNIPSSYSTFTTVAEKLEEWVLLKNFLKANPDIAEQYEVHKTYEILKNDHGTR